VSLAAVLPLYHKSKQKIMNTTETMTATKWVLDAAHSEIKFKVRHMMISNVTGAFNEINAKLEGFDNDLTSATVEFSAKTGSVNTGSEQRDGHLTSADFFESEKYPEMKFVSTKFEKKSGDDYIMHGNLTIKDVTKEISMEVEHGGIVKDPWGNLKNGFSLNGKINRKDFGLNWNAALETGGVLVSEEVKITAEVQLIEVQLIKG
jgi:polyisoprenoid-binding protein YceI